MFAGINQQYKDSRGW